MPKTSNQSIAAFPSDRIEGYCKGLFFSKEISIEAAEAALIKFGLDPYEVELIMLRFLEEKSMAEIVKEQGWCNLRSANHFLRKTIKKLRDGRFRLR